MRRGDKHGLELRRRQINTLIDHRVKEPAEPFSIRCFRRLKIGHFTIGKEERKHGSYSIHPDLNASLPCSFDYTSLEPGAKRFEPVVGTVFWSRFNVAKPADTASGLPDSVPA